MNPAGTPRAALPATLDVGRGRADTHANAFLERVPAAMLRQFPFCIKGFHSDNGREFIHAIYCHYNELKSGS